MYLGKTMGNCKFCCSWLTKENRSVRRINDGVGLVMMSFRFFFYCKLGIILAAAKVFTPLISMLCQTSTRNRL